MPSCVQIHQRAGPGSERPPPAPERRTACREVPGYQAYAGLRAEQQPVRMPTSAALLDCARRFILHQEQTGNRANSLLN